MDGETNRLSSNQWVPGALSLGVKWPGVNLTTHVYVALSLRMNGAIPPLHNTSSLHAA